MGLLAGFSTALDRLGEATLSRDIARLLGDARGERSAGEDGHREAVFPLPQMLKQIHSPDIVAAADTSGPGVSGSGVGEEHDDRAGALINAALPVADGLTSNLEQGGLLAVKTADCVPLLAADPEGGRYAALHAGWRGTAAGILTRLLNQWREAGSSLSQVRLVLGPHIRSCCFEVGEDCLAHFEDADLIGAVLRNGGRPHLDLGSVLRIQADRAGVAPERVHLSAPCTRCHTGVEGQYPYASYRRVSAAGRPLEHTNVAVIGVAPNTRRRSRFRVDV